MPKFSIKKLGASFGRGKSKEEKLEQYNAQYLHGRAIEKIMNSDEYKMGLGIILEGIENENLQLLRRGNPDAMKILDCLDLIKSRCKDAISKAHEAQKEIAKLKEQ